MDIKAKGTTTYQGALARLAKVESLLKPQDRTFVITQPSQTEPGKMEFHATVLLTPDRTFMATAFISLGNIHVLG